MVAASSSSPLPASKAFIFVEHDESVEQGVHHFLHDAGLNLVMEKGDGEVESSFENDEGGGQVVCSMRKDKCDNI